MKKIILSLIILIVFTLLTSCSAGYVSKVPVYQENRPPRPSERHVWVEGNWIWSRRSHAYHHGQGTWIIPVRNRTFQSGRWYKHNRGNHWQRGRWNYSFQK